MVNKGEPSEVDIKKGYTPPRVPVKPDEDAGIVPPRPPRRPPSEEPPKQPPDKSS